MSGWKTWTGTVGYALCEGLKALAPEHAALLVLLQQGVFMPLGVIGIGHKLDRAGVQS